MTADKLAGRARRARERLTPHRVVLVLGSLSALLLALLTPLFQTPDEQQHYIRALSVSRGELWPPMREGQRGTFGPAAFPRLSDQFHAKREHRQISIGETLSVFAVPDTTEPVFLPMRRVAIYLPQGYLPQAVGVGIARALDLNLAWQVLLGRLVNLIVATGVIAYAIRRMPLGREAAMVVALLPMTVSLLGSMNADATSIAGAFLFTALLTASFHDGRWDLRRMGGIALGMVMLCSTKIVYVPLLAAGGVLLLTRTPWRTRFGVVAAQAVVAGLLAWMLYSFTAATGALQTASHMGANGELQMAGVVADPLEFLATVARTIERYFLWFVQSTIGVLSWNTVYLTRWVYLPVLLALPLALLASRDHTSPLPLLAHAGFGVLIGSTVLLVFLGQYLVWTSIGAPMVGGVQGRYFLPVLPLAAYSLTSLAAPLRRFVNADVCYLSVVASLVCANVVTWMVVISHYALFG